MSEARGRPIFGDEAFVDAVVGTASELFHLPYAFFHIVAALCVAAYGNPFGMIASFFQVREPIVGHKLDPEGGQHVNMRRLLIVAVRLRRVGRQSMSVAALACGGLNASEKFPADHLRIGSE